MNTHTSIRFIVLYGWGLWHTETIIMVISKIIWVLLTNEENMRKFEILSELPKYDAKTQGEQVLVEKQRSTDLLNAGVATNL